MKQPNEVSAEKIASLEARIQQKNRERMEARKQMAQFQTRKRLVEAKLQTEKQQLDAKNRGLEMEAAKLRAELKAVKIQGRADHCSRHPRMLAGFRVDCGGGDGQGHLLCVGCIRSWSSNPADLGHCPFCKKPIKSGQLGARELKQLVDKLLADEKMLRPDTSLPLPFELSAEIWEFAKKNSFVLYGHNQWGNAAGSFAGNLKFSEDCLAVNKGDLTPYWSTVCAVKPFCMLKAALIDYCVPDIFYFEVLVKKGYIYIGLSDPNFPLAKDTWVGGEPGSYSLDSWANYYDGSNQFRCLRREKGWYAMGGLLFGDVAGCGLLLSSKNDNRHRLFFTKNGQPFGKSILLPAMANNQQLIFPTVTLLSSYNTSIVANFGNDPKKRFYYKFRKGASRFPSLTWVLSAFAFVALFSYVKGVM